MSTLVERIASLARGDSGIPQMRVASVEVPLATARELVAEFLDGLNYSQNPATMRQIALCALRTEFLENPLGVTQRIVKSGFFVRDIRIEVLK